VGKGGEPTFLWRDDYASGPTKKRSVLSNGLRYRLVGGTRQRQFDGTNSKPRKLLENAQTPTSRVHAARCVGRR
jgi:hypothetical protein